MGLFDLLFQYSWLSHSRPLVAGDNSRPLSLDWNLCEPLSLEYSCWLVLNYVRLDHQNGAGTPIWDDAHIRHRMNSRHWATGEPLPIIGLEPCCVDPMAQLLPICVPWCYLWFIALKGMGCWQASFTLYTFSLAPRVVTPSPSSGSSPHIRKSSRGGCAYLLWGPLRPRPCNTKRLFQPMFSLTSKCPTWNEHSLCA